MGLVHCDFVVEKLLGSKNDFVVGSDIVALCYNLGFVLCKAGFLCQSGPDLSAQFSECIACGIGIFASLNLKNPAYLYLYYIGLAYRWGDLFLYAYYYSDEIPAFRNPIALCV